MFKIAVCWFITTLVALLAWFVYFPKSLLGHMVLFIWVVSGIVVLYRARKAEKVEMPDSQRIFFLLTGVFIILLSFINQVSGFIFWNPPYSLGEFAVLLSGLTIIFFTLFGYRSLLLPASFPLITVFVYQVVDLFQENIDWIASPLLGPTTWLSVRILNLIGINASISGEYVINFLTREGQVMNIPIVIDCTGIWSLS
ncbi:MAG: archaeosortase/exosortase family protein, partial [Candidatus Altiarchaeota archaeon]|nr:archaeosortase/exosortase family protein [Candidatus Altiarchaeota archaeon]